jgi:hypothetical protein
VAAIELEGVFQVVQTRAGVLVAAVDDPAIGVEQGGRALASGTSWLQPGARAGIISFHSLEDRLVKHSFAEWEREGLGTRLTRKPAEAADAEIRANPRARSAKFRVFEFGTESAADR